VECGTDKGLVSPALPGAVAVWSVALIRVWCHLIYRVLLQCEVRGTDKGLVSPALPGAVAVWSVALIRVWCHLLYRVRLQCGMWH